MLTFFLIGAFVFELILQCTIAVLRYGEDDEQKVFGAKKQRMLKRAQIFSAFVFFIVHLLSVVSPPPNPSIKISPDYQSIVISVGRFTPIKRLLKIEYQVSTAGDEWFQYSKEFEIDKTAQICARTSCYGDHSDEVSIEIYAKRNGDSTLLYYNIAEAPSEHKYSIVIGRKSWFEAQQYALEKGGYLVQFDDQEEFDYVTRQIKNAGFEKNHFFIGGRRNSENKAQSKEYRWEDKKESPDDIVLNPVNDKDVWYSNTWFKGEPSWSYENKNTGTVVEEYFMELFFDESVHRWGWNDVPEKLTSPKEDYLHGFIIEYDSRPDYFEEVIDLLD